MSSYISCYGRVGRSSRYFWNQNHYRFNVCTISNAKLSCKWKALSKHFVVNLSVLLSSGYYVYIEASSPRSKGHKAWLQSPTFSPSNGRCLQFWYHMYGYQVGTLNVLKYENSSRSSPLYSLSGSQGNMWRIAQVTIASTVNHKVIFYLFVKCDLVQKL